MKIYLPKSFVLSKQLRAVSLIALMAFSTLSITVQPVEAMLGSIDRITTDSSDLELTNATYISDVSSDGRYAVFSSAESDLVAGDTNGVDDVFRKDLQTGTVIRVSTDSSDAEADDACTTNTLNVISNDGRYVVFESPATNLVASDTNAETDIFLKDIQTGTTTRISTDSSGSESDGMSLYPSISGDGNFVVFHSAATNLVASDTNGFIDVFRKEVGAGTTIRVSTDSSDTESDDHSFEGSMSTDGRYVVFHSDATNLIGSDTNASGDVFMKDAQTGTTTRISTDSSDTEADAGGLWPSVSANGDFVAFYSESTNLVASDTNGVGDVFVKNISTGDTIRASSDSADGQLNGLSDGAVISSDGRFVTFYSDATDVVGGDTNAVTDSFIKDTQTGEVQRASTDASDGEGDGPSYAGILTADNTYLFFSSDATNLIGSDTNAVTDGFRKDVSAFTTNALGAQPTGRAVDISTSAKNATNVTLEFRFTPPEASPIQGIRLLFCTSPLAEDTCTKPAGLDVSGYSVASQSFSEATAFTAQPANENECTVANGANNEKEICVQRTDIDSETVAQKTLTIDGVTNPSVTGTVYVRISLYDAATINEGARFSDGSVAYAIVEQIQVSARIMERIVFTVGTSTDADNCGTISSIDTTVDLGVLDTGTINRVSASGNDLDVACAELTTNASQGANIQYYADDLKVTGATCAGSTDDDGGAASDTDQCINRDSDADAGSSTTITTGDEQWGMSAPETPDNGTTTNNLTAAAGYDEDTLNEFSFTPNTATVIGSSTTVVDSESLEIDIGATSGITTPTGLYSTTVTFIATATF